MLTFTAIDDYLDLDGISLPIGGKHYLIVPPSALVGIEVTHRVAVATEHSQGHRAAAQQMQELSDQDERDGGDLARQVLGPALDEMIADGVPWPMLRLAFQTGMVWIAQGVEQAALFWAAGGGEMGKAPASTPPTTRQGRQGSTGSKSRRRRRVSPGAVSSSTGI